MRARNFVLPIAALLVGVAIGVAGMIWQANRQWGQWFISYNAVPLLGEDTYSLKKLRAGNARELELTLDETVWRNLAMLAAAVNNGGAIPANAAELAKYHCESSAPPAATAASEVASKRTEICSTLLAYFAKSSSAR